MVVRSQSYSPPEAIASFSKILVMPIPLDALETAAGALTSQIEAAAAKLSLKVFGDTELPVFSQGMARRAVVHTGPEFDAAKSMFEEVGPKFRIKTNVHVRDGRPEDSARINDVARHVGLGEGEFDTHRLKVLDAQGFGVVGFSQIRPGEMHNLSDGSPSPFRDIGKVKALGVLQEFRNRSKPLLDALVADMRKFGGWWKTDARDATIGPLMHYLEERGTIDIQYRWPMDVGRGGHPATLYQFRVNSERQAEIARTKIAADTIVRPAAIADAQPINQIAEKFGVKWHPSDLKETIVADAVGHGVVGYARVGYNNEVSFGVLQQFRHSSADLIGKVASDNAGHFTSIALPFPTGKILDNLEKIGRIQVLSRELDPRFNYSYYKFRVNN
jgi:hypothetical protein